jgi:hypothetical protein
MVQFVLEPGGSDSEMSELDDEVDDLQDESWEPQSNEQDVEFDGKFKLVTLSNTVEFRIQLCIKLHWH